MEFRFTSWQWLQKRRGGGEGDKYPCRGSEVLQDGRTKEKVFKFQYFRYLCHKKLH